MSPLRRSRLVENHFATRCSSNRCAKGLRYSSLDEDHDASGVKEGKDSLHCEFGVAAQLSVPANSSEETFDHPGRYYTAKSIRSGVLRTILIVMRD